MEADIVELTEKIRRYTLGAVDKDRYEHCISTAQTAARICRITGQDVLQGYLAGVAHDMCRQMGDDLLLSFSKRDGRPVTAFEKANPTKFLHGRAAAVKLQEDFGITNPYILQAVSRHVLGGAFLCPLAKIVYIADKTEPTRPRITTKYTEKLMAMPLNRMAKFVVEESIDYDKKKGRVTASDTLDFLQSLNIEIAQEAQVG